MGSLLTRRKQKAMKQLLPSKDRDREQNSGTDESQDLHALKPNQWTATFAHGHIYYVSMCL